MDDIRPASSAKAGAPPIFTPFTLRGMTIPNRVVVSPMCMYSAVDGTVGDFQLVHLGSRAMGGAGLVITEMTDVSPEGRISPYCAGLYKPEHVAPWKRVVDFIHANSDAKVAVQLAHAGRKGATPPPWERSGDGLGDKAWPLVAPSAIPFGPKSQTPKAMDDADLDKARKDFIRGAKWSDEAGFDMIEFHMGHGYLLSSFLSPLSNHRTDAYGGSVENRLRFPIEVVRAVRAIWPDRKPLAARISAVDWEEGGNSIEDGVKISKALKEAGIDLIDVSTGAVTSARRPPQQGLFQTPFSARIRQEASIPTITVGNIRSAEDANRVIAEGQADLCAVGRWHLYDAYFGNHAAHDLGYDDAPWAKQYLRAKEALE
jgi:anthraniloyl-CoA monooxygenase